VFVSPERRLLFDLNDFDRALPGPFEYDVKRMAASSTILNAGPHRRQGVEVKEAGGQGGQAGREVCSEGHREGAYARQSAGAVQARRAGLRTLFEGLGALLKSGRFYANVSTNYPYGTSVTTWGWVHLIVAAIVLLAGFYVMSGALWARIVGITLASLASLSALANFFLIPFYPFWALLIITLDIFVIWALAAHGRALVADMGSPEAPARIDTRTSDAARR
jgi:hypothetical protein